MGPLSGAGGERRPPAPSPTTNLSNILASCPPAAGIVGRPHTPALSWGSIRSRCGSHVPGAVHGHQEECPQAREAGWGQERPGWGDWAGHPEALTPVLESLLPLCVPCCLTWGFLASGWPQEHTWSQGRTPCLAAVRTDVALPTSRARGQSPTGGRPLTLRGAPQPPGCPSSPQILPVLLWDVQTMEEMSTPIISIVVPLVPNGLVRLC